MTLPARTYGTCELAPDRRAWRITAEPHVAIRLKAMFPKVPKASPGPWTIARDDATDADLRWFMDRYPLAMSAEDRAALDRGQLAFLSRQAEMERILLPDWQPRTYPGLLLGQTIRPYQAQAIELAAASRGLLLGDEVGLGKTYTAAGFCLAPERLPAAIVCPVHIQRQWRDVIQGFTTLRVHMIRTRAPYNLPDADVYVFRYSQVAGWVDVFDKGFFRSVVYDETQDLRGGEETAKGKACAVLSDRAQWRLGLTATPIYNYGQEIWNVLRFIAPEVLGDLHDFRREYCNDYGKLQDPKALGTYLRERHCFLRRTKGDVGRDLPPVNKIVDTVDYDEGEVRAIEETARRLALRASTGAFVDRGQAARELDILVRQATGVAKARAVADVVRILVEGGEPVVLVGWHRAVYDIWQDRLRDLNPALYTGTESATQKAEAVRRFVEGETDVLILSLRSGAGLDGLQKRCSTMVFGELDWSPGIHHQCIGRLDREGQTRPVMALFLVAQDGSDPPMMQILGIKASEATQVIDPHVGVQAVHSDDSRLRALVSRYLDGRGAAAKQGEMVA